MSSPDSKSSPAVTNAWDVPEPTKSSMFSLKWHKLLTRRINALLNLIAVPASSNKPIIISDGNALLPVAGTGTGSGAGGGMNYRGLYNGSTDYALNDVVYTTTIPTSGTRISWVAELINGPSSGVQAPTWPEPGTVYWRALDFFSGGSTVYTYISHYASNPDYITVRPPGGSITGSDDIQVLKPNKLRFSISSEVVDGITINYTAYSYTTQQRTADNGTMSQVEVIVPRYLVGDEIVVETTSDGTKRDSNVDGRAWAGPFA